tara:strand:+ start:355 stop:630 length:276 start_codon:yes stop_codon:yes gene_type:complete
MSQYRVTLRGMLPIEVEVIVEGNTIADAKDNALYPYDCWISNPRVWAVDSYIGSATNEMDMNPSDLFDLDLKLQLAETKIVKLLKADEVEI